VTLAEYRVLEEAVQQEVPSQGEPKAREQDGDPPEC